MTPEQQLRAVAMRVTGPRVAVLTEVRDQPHADVDTLTAKVRARLGSVSTQAVYDVLRALTDAGCEIGLSASAAGVEVELAPDARVEISPLLAATREQLLESWDGRLDRLTAGVYLE